MINTYTTEWTDTFIHSIKYKRLSLTGAVYNVRQCCHVVKLGRVINKQPVSASITHITSTQFKLSQLSITGGTTGGTCQGRETQDVPPELCQGNYDFCLIDSTQLCRVENYNATTSYIYELSYLSPEQVEILCGCGRKRQLYVDVISVNGIFSAVTDLCCHHHQQHCIIVKPMTHLKVFFRKKTFRCGIKGVCHKCKFSCESYLRKWLLQENFWCVTGFIYQYW